MLITVKIIINVMLYPDHIFICRIQKCNKVMSQCQMEKIMSSQMKKLVSSRGNL